jgi:hypothetical protein
MLAANIHIMKGKEKLPHRKIKIMVYNCNIDITKNIRKRQGTKLAKRPPPETSVINNMRRN